MNRLRSLLLCGLVITGLLMVLPVPEVDSIPTRDMPDLRPVIIIPENGERYQKEMGLRVNATVFNDGADMGSINANLSLVITNLETGGKVIDNFFPIRFSGIASGENSSFEFPNWTGAFAGRFVANITVHYQDDAVPGNNYVEHTFSMWSDYYPGRPELISKQVNPIRGNTSTLFTFKTEFKYNRIPDWVKIEVDDGVYDMVEDDPEDDVPNDGKTYRYTTYLPTGNHRYRFRSNLSGIADIITPFTNSPWVNLSLKNVNVTPKKGYVTTPFHFSVDYGSEKADPPSEIYLDIGTRRFNLTRSSPNPDYQGARVEFSTIVEGIDLVPAPLQYYMRCTTAGEFYSVGPFDFEGPRMKEVNLTGKVSDFDGDALPGVVVQIDPGNTIRTNSTGHYSLKTYVGPRFQISYSKAGYLPRSYELDILEDRNLNIELEEVPVGGSISGFVKSPIGGEIIVLEGAMVNISIMGYSNETITSEDGYYLMEGIPAGGPYLLSVSEYRHETSESSVTIKDGEINNKNITLTERDMLVSILPDGNEEPISVDQYFMLEFPETPDLDTFNITLENGTSSVSLMIEAVPNSTQVKILPVHSLIFNSQYTLSIEAGIIGDTTGDLLVWRPLSWPFVTQLQSFTDPVSDPVKDSLDMPLDKEITISFGIGINHSTVSASIYNMDKISEDVPITIAFKDMVNWSDSGRTDTIITISPTNLTHATRYSLEISDLIKDIHGRSLLEMPMIIEFTTIREPDGDGDGVVDSQDPFPEDPNEWSDLDGDTVGDNSDVFPSDPEEWSDLDGDGIGDNSDTDDDGDQIPDAWELDNGLDPTIAGDAFLDNDDDGYSNLEEFLEGTDPQDKGDHPESAGFDTNIIIIAVISVIIIIVVIVVILFMLGVLGKKKADSLDEE